MTLATSPLLDTLDRWIRRRGHFWFATKIALWRVVTAERETRRWRPEMARKVARA